MTGVTGLVLAGGRSRRFGSDKAAYRLNDGSMIERVYTAVEEVCETVLIGVGDGTRTYDGIGGRAISDLVPDAGPLGGLHAGLAASDSPWLLVVACDMPHITAQALHRLLQAREHGLSAAIAVDASGRLHPLCAVYRADVRQRVDEQLRTGQRAMHRLLDRLDRVKTVELDHLVLANVNSPSDLEMLPTKRA